MKKFFVGIFGLALITLGAGGVFAEELSDGNYKNSNDVIIDGSKYDKLCEIYSENFIEFLTQEEYDNIKDKDLDNVTVEETIDYNLARGASYSTSYKSIKLINNGGYITLMLDWLQMPSVRSYDVLAVRLSSTSISGTPSFKQVYYNSGTYTSTTGSRQSFSNGYGVSFLLALGTSLESYLSFYVTESGTVYGAYQHATSSVTLANSKNYTISSSGYGGVINFASSVADYYDHMSGVSLAV